MQNANVAVWLLITNAVCTIMTESCISRLKTHARVFVREKEEGEEKKKLL